MRGWDVRESETENPNQIAYEVFSPAVELSSLYTYYIPHTRVALLIVDKEVIIGCTPRTVTLSGQHFVNAYYVWTLLNYDNNSSGGIYFELLHYEVL